MDLKMAVNALQTISRNHIWVLKATKKREELHDKVKEDPEWALKTVIRSFNNTCDIKHIKAELVPDILSAGEWATWSGKAREILKTDPGFGVSPDNIDVFTVRDRPITMEEKLYNEFKAERNFFERALTIRNYADQKDVELDSEYFTEMFGYFSAYLRTKGQITEQVAASYLIIKDMVAKFPHLSAGLSLNFIDIFEGIEDVPSLLLSLRDTKLREAFLRCIQLFVPDWPDIFVKLFPYALSASIIASLKKEGHEDKLVAMTQRCFENYRDHREIREAALWILKNHKDEIWFDQAGITPERQLIVLVHILNITYRDIENRRDTTENRKINKQAYAMLFKDDTLSSFIDQADEDAILRVYTLIDDVKDLDPADKLSLRNRILQKRPGFKFLRDAEKTTVSRSLLVTMAKYEEKQRELARIMDVEIPLNSKEIGFALSLGDLRENAEYKAAKEKQDLLNSTAAKLKDEIDRAQLFDPASVNVSRVSFGAKALLFNGSTGETEEYTILGPWESDPDNRIISYLSPLGSAILNRKSGEQFEFSINNEKISYTVREISAAEF
jgi:transcription elongation factor GreA